MAGASSETILLPRGLVFSVTERIPNLVVEYGISPLLLELGAFITWTNEGYIGELGEPYTQMVHLVIGRLRDPWTEEGLTEALSDENCLHTGSGLWVGAAFRAKFPGRTEVERKIWFPDAKSSRWVLESDGGRTHFPGMVCLPDLWWRALSNPIDKIIPPSEELCLIATSPIR